MNEPDPGCACIRDLLPEIAAGVAAGDERARAMEHLGTCAECRRELAETADTLDELLLLAPERRLPAGFARGVLAEIEPAREPRLRAVARWTVALAAAASTAAGLVWWRTSDDRALAESYRHTLHVAHGTDFRAAPIAPSGGTEIATVFAYEGIPSWLYATFRRQPAPGHYDVRLFVRSGRSYAIFYLDTEEIGHSWASRIPSTIRLRDITRLEFRKSTRLAMTADFR
jgi:hypothetical protein